MKVSDYELNLKRTGVELIIKPVSANKFVLGFLLVVVIFCFLVPFSIFFIDKLKIQIGYLLTILIFWGVSFFFLRIFLWNFKGKEVFLFTKNEVYHYFDFFLFKDRKSIFGYKNLKIGYVKIKGIDKVYLINNKHEKKPKTPCHLVVIADMQKIISEQQIYYESVTHLSELLHLEFVLS
jgi:hypothetical protein